VHTIEVDSMHAINLFPCKDLAPDGWSGAQNHATVRESEAVLHWREAAERVELTPEICHDFIKYRTCLTAGVRGSNDSAGVASSDWGGRWYCSENMGNAVKNGDSEQKIYLITRWMENCVDGCSEGPVPQRPGSEV
jgi:hypothetical protein